MVATSEMNSATKHTVNNGGGGGTPRTPDCLLVTLKGDEVLCETTNITCYATSEVNCYNIDMTPVINSNVQCTRIWGFGICKYTGTRVGNCTVKSTCNCYDTMIDPCMMTECSNTISEFQNPAEGITCYCAFVSIRQQ